MLSRFTHQPRRVEKDEDRTSENTEETTRFLGSYPRRGPILFRGWRRWVILLILFSLAATGITFNFLYFNGLPEIFGLMFYVAMGWVGAYSGYALYHRYGWGFIRPLVWGGIAYTLGGAMEFLRRPVLIDGVVGPHEIFHLAVLAGLGFHFRFAFSFAGKK